MPLRAAAPANPNKNDMRLSLTDRACPPGASASPAMSVLRNVRALARFVLAWFVLSVSVAIASPVVHPQSMQVMCTAEGGIKILVQGDDGMHELGASHLDCPVCMPTGAPPAPAQPIGFPAVPPLAHAVQSIPSARIAAATAAALPPRGPPALA